MGYALVQRMSALLRGARRREVPPVVLTYHGVAEADVPLFERQMQTLSKQARSVFPDEVADQTDRPAVAVTFDDAFQSVFDRALPILKKYRIVSTIFVPTGSIGGAPKWIAGTRAKDLGPVASEQTLKALDSALVRIGSHTVTHPRLSTLDQERLTWELESSKRALEALAGAPVQMLSLPFGSGTPGVVDAANRAGYRRVFANVPVSGGDATGLMGRINVTPHDWPIEFALKLNGAYGWMAFAVPAKRTLSRWFRHEAIA